MKPITWLRKFVARGDKGYPVATLAFYGPDDKKASKAVLGVIASKGAEPQLHKWFGESPELDLRYDTKLQNAWIEIIRREGVRSLAMMEAIKGARTKKASTIRLARSVRHVRSGLSTGLRAVGKPPPS
jgi:hypothetical protein